MRFVLIFVLPGLTMAVLISVCGWSAYLPGEIMGAAGILAGVAIAAPREKPNKL